MGKKIRYQYLTGALLDPFFHYINKIEVGINPVSDPRGTRIGTHLYKFANETRPLFKGEKFQSSINYDFTSNNSWVIFHYLTGLKQGYLLKHLDMKQFELEKKVIDKNVEFQRVCEGHEDEYDDEVRK